MPQDAFAETLQAFVDAAVENEGWRRPLDLAEKTLGVRAVIVMGYERFGDARYATVEGSSGLPHEATPLYESHYVKFDVRAEYGAKLGFGRVVCDQDFGDLAALDRTPVYGEFFRPFDVGRCTAISLGADPSSRADRSVFITLLKHNTAPPPTALERTRLKTMAHVARGSLRAAAAITALRADGAAKASALDRAPFGCLILDHYGRIRELNAAARAALQRHDGLSDQKGRLTAADPSAQAAIDRICAATVNGDPGPQIVSARRIDGAAPYGLMLVRLRRDIGAWLMGDSGSAALVFIVDPAQKQSPFALWRHMFALTPCEGEVASLLAAGMSHREIAAARGVKPDTIHTQVKHIYQKLDVTSQAQAATRLARAAPFYDNDN